MWLGHIFCRKGILDPEKLHVTACILAWPGGGLNFEIHAPESKDLQVVCTLKNIIYQFYAGHIPCWVLFKITLKNLKMKHAMLESLIKTIKL